MSDKNTPPENSKTVQVDPKDKGYEAEPVSSINAGKNVASKQTKDESARKANDYTPHLCKMAQAMEPATNKGKIQLLHKAAIWTENMARVAHKIWVMKLHAAH